MAATIAHNLKTDDNLIGCEWFPAEDDVFACLRGMQEAGWYVTRHGLESVDEQGQRCIARPVKIKGNDWFSGVATWRVSDDDQF